jgi:hypothetical protein
MVPKIDHYVPLLRAVASLDRTSYEARGAIYDRALAIVVERLGATVPPLSQADIDQELLAFRAAVRRIEFGDMDEQDSIAEHGVAQRARYLASRREQRQNETPRLDAYPAALPDDGRQAAAQPDDALPSPAPEVLVLTEMAEHRSVLHRVAMRMILPVLLVAAGLAGYAYESGQIGEPFVGQLLGRVAPAAGLTAGEDTQKAAEPATYSEQTSGNVPSQELKGSARWRTRIEDAASGSQTGSHATVITLDLLIPERGLAMAMAIRRDASDNAAMTHLLEFKFSDRKGAPFEGIAAVGNIVMKQADGSRGSALAGLSIKVAPGVFLFGLSADKDDARHNAEALRALSRLDIPVTFADGSAATISLHKGESGERAFGAALADWER